jgi:hypothetical protein
MRAEAKRSATIFILVRRGRRRYDVPTLLYINNREEEDNERLPPLTTSMYRVTSLLPLVLAASLCAASTDTSNGGSAAPLKRAEAGAGKTIHLRAGHEHAHGHHHRHDHHGRDAQTTFAPIDALTPAQACPAQAVTSCSSDAGATSACCVLRPDGALVHVQFWDVGLGVADSCVARMLHPATRSGSRAGDDSGSAFMAFGRTSAAAA